MVSPIPAAGVPFYLKRWGEFEEMGERVGKLSAGAMLEAQVWNQMPKLWW